MAKKYEKHKTDEGKYQSTIDRYGHGKGNGKSRQAVTKNHDKVTAAMPILEPDIPEPVKVVEEVKEEETTEEVKEVAEEPEKPEWLNVEFDGSDMGDEKVQSIPSPVKGLLATMSGQADPNAIKTPAQVQAWYAQQARLVRFALAGVVDPIFSWWGKAITADENFIIERSHEEWEMTEAITEQFLAYNQISFMVSPNLLMGGMLGALYIPPVIKMQRQRDPNRVGFFGRIMSKWKRRRALKKALKENPHLTAEDVEGEL